MTLTIFSTDRTKKKRMVYFVESNIVVDNIKRIAKQQGIKLGDMLKACGLGVNTLNQITDKKGLSSVSLSKIADYLGCGVDYLLGRQIEPEEKAACAMYDSSEIAARIKEMAKSQGKPIGTVLSECGLGVNTVSKLSNGTDLQSKNLAKIADNLGCSVDYLLGRETTSNNKFDNLFKIIAEKGLTAKKVSEDTGISTGNISDWKSGRSAPSAAKLKILADYLDTSADILLGRETTKRKGVKIPVLGRVQAGIPVEAIQEILDYEEITEEQAATGEFFGLCVRGHSMEPVLLDGDVVIVRQQPTADSGDTVVALVNGDDATVKRLKHTPNGIALIPVNAAFETLYYTFKEIEELPVRIIGKVVELRRKF